MSGSDGAGVPASSRLRLGELLAAAEAVPPVSAVEAVGGVLARMVGAEHVGFLIADYSGDALIRLGHSQRSGNTLEWRETAERVPLEGTPQGAALSEQVVQTSSDD